MAEATAKKPGWYHIILREGWTTSHERVWADDIYAIDRGWLHGRVIRLSLGDRTVAEFPASRVKRWYASDSRWM